VLSASKPVVDVFRTGPDAEGVVRLQGRVRFASERVGATIGQGTTASKGCTCDEDAEPPEFDCWCQMATDDAEAWVELLTSQGGFYGPFATVRARRAGAPRSYTRPTVRLPKRDDDATALVDGINVLRKKAGHIARAGNAADWLAFELMLPTSRRFLLDARAESIALVTHHDPAVGFGAAFGVYSFFRESDDAAAATYAYAGMERQRLALGLATKRVEPPAELARAAKRVSSGELAPDQALSEAVASINANAQRLFRGSWFKLSSSVELPEPLLAMKDLECALVVAHRKGARGLSGEQVVLAVYPIVGKAS
jgi:hypothetical protein